MSEKNFILAQQVAFQLISSGVVYAQRELPAIVHSIRVTPEGIVFRTSPSKLRLLGVYLRNSTMFRMRSLTDIAVVDRLLSKGRFVVNYNLLSTRINQRVTVQLAVSETEPIPSLLGSPLTEDRLYPAAN